MSQDERIEGERAEGNTLAGLTRSARVYRIGVMGLLAGTAILVVVWYVVHVRDHLAEASVTRTATRGNATSESRLPALVVPARAPRAPAPLLGADGATTTSERPAVQGPAEPRLPATATRSDLGARPEWNRKPDIAPVLLRAVAATASLNPPAEVAANSAWTEALTANSLSDPVMRPSQVRANGPTGTTSEASVLPDRRFLLPKGSFLDCTLETAIDSTLPGLATCVLATDVYGGDGRVVLMERGTRLIGEVRAEVRAGQSRVAVVWEEARTPTGVRLTLSSPGTDALGRAGIPGVVDRHFGERFGAAVLLSFLDAGANAIAARQQAGAIIYNPQASRDIASEALRGSIGILPTIRVEPGAKIQVAVASDVNFRAIYRLLAHDAS